MWTAKCKDNLHHRTDMKRNEFFNLSPVEELLDELQTKIQKAKDRKKAKLRRKP